MYHSRRRSTRIRSFDPLVKRQTKKITVDDGKNAGWPESQVRRAAVLWACGAVHAQAHVVTSADDLARSKEIGAGADSDTNIIA